MAYPGPGGGPQGNPFGAPPGGAMSNPFGAGAPPPGAGAPPPPPAMGGPPPPGPMGGAPPGPPGQSQGGGGAQSNPFGAPPSAGGVSNPFGGAAPPPSSNNFGGPPPPGPGGPPPGPGGPMGGPPPPGPGGAMGGPFGAPPPTPGTMASGPGAYGAPAGGPSPYNPQGGPFGGPPGGMGGPGPSPYGQPGGLAGAGEYLTNQYGANGPMNGPGVSLGKHTKLCEESNAPEHFCQMTCKQWPEAASVKSKTGVPVALTFRALAPCKEGSEIPLINYGNSGSVLRCSGCRTYINPFVRWEANGARWVCNMCGSPNDTDPSNICVLDNDGKRRDHYQRPEYCQGSVEYVASREYMNRAPQPAVFLFAIDVSYQSVQSGFVATACNAIKEMIEGISSEEDDRRGKMTSGGGRTQVGIITYDRSVHYYNLNPSLPTPQMTVVADLEDLFLPHPVLVNATDSEEAIISLLDMIPDIHASTNCNDSCMGSAVQAGHLAMKHIGGKMCLFGGTLPQCGAHALKATRDNPRNHSSPEMLNPESGAWKRMALDLTKHQIGVEIFQAAQSFCDLASIAPLAKNSGGDLRFYPGFYGGREGDRERLREDIHHVLSRQMGWEAVMRIRVTHGWRLSGFFGNLYKHERDLLVVPNCHEGQNVTVTVELADPAKKPDPIWCVQCALLYTNSDNERRIRVHTVSGICTASPQQILQTLSGRAIACAVSNMCIDLCQSSKITDARNFIQTTCQHIMGAAAQNGAMEESEVKKLPKLFMGLLKTKAFMERDVYPDVRIAEWARMISMSPEHHEALYIPKLYALLDLKDGDGQPNADGVRQWPEDLPATSATIQEDGAYLLHDGQDIYIFTARGINPNFWQQVFGVPQPDEQLVAAPDSKIGSNGDPLGMKVRALIDGIRAHYGGSNAMKLTLVPAGNQAMEGQFINSLFDDRTPGLRLTSQEFEQRMGVGMPRAGQVPGHAPPLMQAQPGMGGFPQVPPGQMNRGPPPGPGGPPPMGGGMNQPPPMQNGAPPQMGGGPPPMQNGAPPPMGGGPPPMGGNPMASQFQRQRVGSQRKRDVPKMQEGLRHRARMERPIEAERLSIIIYPYGQKTTVKSVMELARYLALVPEQDMAQAVLMEDARNNRPLDLMGWFDSIHWPLTDAAMRQRGVTDRLREHFTKKGRSTNVPRATRMFPATSRCCVGLTLIGGFLAAVRKASEGVPAGVGCRPGDDWGSSPSGTELDRQGAFCQIASSADYIRRAHDFSFAEASARSQQKFHEPPSPKRGPTPFPSSLTFSSFLVVAPAQGGNPMGAPPPMGGPPPAGGNPRPMGGPPPGNPMGGPPPGNPMGGPPPPGNPMGGPPPPGNPMGGPPPPMGGPPPGPNGFNQRPF